MLAFARAWRPRSMTRRTSATSARIAASAPAGLGPAGQEHRVRDVLGGARDEVLPEVLGEEREHRGDHAQRLHERVPERLERRAVAAPEPAAGAADVPVREVVDERLVGSEDRDRQRRVVARRRLLDEVRRAGDEPAVERQRRRARAAVEIAGLGTEALDVRVLDEERDGVPQRQQLALDLLPGPVAEPEVLVRRLGAVLPAHDVGAHARERVVGLDEVAPRAVHLAAVLVDHLLVAEDLAERGPAGQDDRHEELRVEPQADLLAHLRDPVGREPLLPVGVVGEVRPREPPRRAGRVAALDPLRVLPAEGGEGDDPGVEPDVADLADPGDLVAAGLAADRHVVDPRAPELLELVEPAGRAPLELRPRPDDVEVAARARVEGEGEAVEALARDVPVVHVAQPVVHAPAHVVRRPAHRRVGLERPRADLVHGDEPVLAQAEDQRGLAAPAVRVAVDDLLGGDDPPALGEVRDDLVGDLAGPAPVEPAVVLEEAARFVDRRDDVEPERAATARSPRRRSRARCGRCRCPPRG